MKLENIIQKEIVHRRSFIKRCFKMFGVVGAGVLTFGVMQFFRSGPAEKNRNDRLKGAFHPDMANMNRKKNRLSAVRASDGWYEMPANIIKNRDTFTMAVGGVPVIIVNDSDEVRIFDSTCTHLGCLVKWHPQKRMFVCPCHAGTYNFKGEPVSGPPPYKLKEYEAVVENEKIRIKIA